MMNPRALIITAGAACVCALIAASTVAQSTQPASTQPSAEEVLHQLMDRRAENPLIEPARPLGDATTRPAHDSPHRMVGHAPGRKLPLRGEGQFVISRRGRMIGTQSPHLRWMFTFDSDTDTLDDPPMILLPCQLLEDMEQIVAREGDAAAFTISGQIFVYHGANYLMPTMVKRVADRGNLQP
ncbi:MAG: hypothetical protein CMJ49_13500 [Planctomycetaceae bacterium]|nr:hypothetical protein [Planctomycetaceae bacterium]